MRTLPENDIYLKEPEHIYLSKETPNIILNSATSFISRFFPKFNSTKVSRDIIKRGSKNYAAFENASQIREDWNQRMDLGSLVHDQLDLYCKKGIYPDHVRARAGWMWLNYILKHDNFELLSEQRIGVPQLQLAGTIDLLVWDPQTNSYIIVDWKTNKTIYTSSFKGGTGIKPETVHLSDCNFSKYTLQLNLYRWILETYYNLDVRGCYLIHLRERITRKYDIGIKQYSIDYNPYTIQKMVNRQLHWMKTGNVFTSKDVAKWTDLDL